MIEDINSANPNSQELPPPSQELPAAEGEMPLEDAAAPKGGGLPWMLFFITLAAALVGGFFGYQQLAKAQAQADLLTHENADLNSRFSKQDNDRKSAETRATDLAQQNEDLTTKLNAATDQLKQRDLQLTQLEAKVAKAHALARGVHGRAGKQIAALLASAAAPLPNAAGHGHKHHRGF